MAKTDDRLFAPFPIEMDEHPKIIGLSDAAFRAVFEAVFYSRRMMSDGFLDERVVLRRWGQGAADELSSNDPERPSWIRVESPRPGWLIHDFDKHHPLRADIEEKRAAISGKRSDAGKKGAAKRWQTDGKSVANDSSETETETETRNTLSSEVAIAPIRRDVEWLLDLLDQEIEANGGKRPSRNKKNADAARLLIDRDGHSVEAIERVIRWCQADEFWRSNILSMSKLRDKYEQLRLAAQRNPGKGQRLAKADANFAEYQRLYGGGDGGRAGSVPALDARVG